MGISVMNVSGGHRYLVLQMEMPYFGRQEDAIPKSNYPIRIYNNQFSKVIVLADFQNDRISQIVLEHKELYPKDVHIDYIYLHNVFVRELMYILENEYRGAIRNDDGEICLDGHIIIIAEGKSYVVYEGNVIETNVDCSSPRADAFMNCLLRKEKLDGYELARKTFEIEEKYFVGMYPSIYFTVDDKDYRIRKYNGLWRDR